MKVILLPLIGLLILAACSRQSVARVAPPPPSARTAPAPAPPRSDEPLSQGTVEMDRTVVRADDERVEADVEKGPLTREEMGTPTGRKSGYVPRVAENETALIENQGSLGAAPITDTDGVPLPEDAPVLTVIKSPCFGDCDVYRLDVLQDGRMVLEVENGLLRPGTYVQTLSSFDRRDLMTALDSLGTNDYATVYPTDPADIPDDGSYTTLTLPNEEGEPRSVTVYYGAPLELDAFLRRIGQLIDEQAWTPE